MTKSEIQAAVIIFRVARKKITNIIHLRNHGVFKNISCFLEISIGRNRPPMLIRNIAAANVYGDDANFVIASSNGPDGGTIEGGGPPKLIYNSFR